MGPAPFPSFTTTWHTDTYPAISFDRPELSVKDKTVLITGGGTGIGGETARHFAAAGATKIALLGRRKERLEENKSYINEHFPHANVFTASVDVTIKEQVDGAFRDFLGESGKVDIVVSGAAFTGATDAARSIDGDAFIKSVNINLLGGLYTAQAFIRHAAPDAVAVNISSMAAHVNFGAGFAAYNVAKFATFRLWDTIGANAPDTRVFHIQPGVVDTEMNREVGGVKNTGIEDQVALPAGFILWLASEEARFLKGKFLYANWDVEELKAKRGEIEQGGLLDIGLVGWPFGGGFNLQLPDNGADSAFNIK